MNHTIIPGGLGLISLIVSILLFVESIAKRKFGNLLKTIYLVSLKAKALARNKIFILSEKTALILTGCKIRRILFSKKEEWDTIINKSFSSNSFKVEFNQFSPLRFGYYDLVVPLTIPDLRICVEQRSYLPDQAISIPSSASLELCNDKSAFNKFMISNGFADYIPGIEEVLHFPYMLKKKVDEYGRSTFIINNSGDENFYREALNDDAFYRQELIPGKHEYATHILFKDGKIQASLNIRYTFENNNYIKGKEKYICKEVCHTNHKELFSKILGKIGFEGICCLNYKEVNGRPMIFEINPRFGGSLTDYFFSFMRRLN